MNRLSRETSPYLLQHAHNPVDWYPWGPEAFGRAQAEDKPILLSVGYSACHWCHVMERESFEDAGIAALMNERFVNVKVDREERPDVDDLYMRAVQSFQRGRGGWPMTVFLTPTGQPYWGGTYFPPEPRGGMPAFPDILRRMSSLWTEHRADVVAVAEEMVALLDRSGRMSTEGDLTGGWLEAVAASAAADFDTENAGFGGAPKFPAHGLLAALLAHWRVSGSRESLRIATRTLSAMARGGMYDLAGGGFARYSVDAAWRVPHFEKMLYDNAQLVPVYADAARITGSAHFRRVVEETLGWCTREMRLPHGGFATSTDADTDGVEGATFVWTPAQLREVLGEAEGRRAAELLQVTGAGTFEHGTSVLRLEQPLEALGEGDRALLERALPALRAARDRRPQPARDDKAITAWNALMISAYARAGAAFGRDDWIAVARRAARFLLEEATVAGRLMRSVKDGQARHPGLADDHAALILALLDLYEADFDPAWLDQADHLADRTVDLFWDPEGGALFATGRDAEALVVGSKRPVGGAEPSGNGMAALAFVRLAALTGRAELGDRAERILVGYQELLRAAPRAIGLEAIAGHWRSSGGQELGITGRPDDPAVVALLAEARRRYLPFAVVAVVPREDDARFPWMAGRFGDPTPTAWLCEGHVCRLPTRDPAELGALLDGMAEARAPVRVHAPELPTDPALWLNAERPLPLASLRGRVVVLDFWTYCCINCLHVLPELAAVEAHYRGGPVVVLGVHAAKFPAEKEREAVAHAVARHRIGHPVVLDPEHRLWQAYAVRSWPTLAIVDPTGRIAWQRSGETSREELIEAIDDLLVEAVRAGTLGAFAPPAAPRPAASGFLRHPGKVEVWPDAQAQAQGQPAFGKDARLYLADTGHDRILECQLSLGGDGWPRARVLRVFGGGGPGLVDGRPDQARFRAPQGMSRHGGVLYVADTENHAIRTIDLGSGEVRTLAGTGSLARGGALDPRNPRGTPLRSPWDVAAVNTRQGPGVFVAMAGTHQIWIALPDGLGPYAGSGREDHVDGALDEAAFAQPSGLLLYRGLLFVADSEISSIRAIDLEQLQVMTLVGRGLFDFGDVDGTGEVVRLQHPLDVTAIGDLLYVADTFNHKVKSLTLDGRVDTVAGGRPEVLCEPGGITAAGPFLVVADTNHHRVRAVDTRTGEVRDLPIVSSQASSSGGPHEPSPGMA